MTAMPDASATKRTPPIRALSYCGLRNQPGPKTAGEASVDKFGSSDFILLTNGSVHLAAWSSRFPVKYPKISNYLLMGIADLLCVSRNSTKGSIQYRFRASVCNHRLAWQAASIWSRCSGNMSP